MAADSREQIRLIGDKQPRKFYFRELLEKTRQNITISRPLANAMWSWEERAKNTSDPWDESAIGTWALLDFALFLSCARRLSGPLVVVDYEQLYFGAWAQEVQLLAASLGVKFDSFDEDRFLKDFYRRSAVLETRRIIGVEQAQTLELLGVHDLSASFRVSEPINREQVLRTFAQEFDYSTALLAIERLVAPDKFAWLRQVSRLTSLSTYPPFDGVETGSSAIAAFLRARWAERRAELDSAARLFKRASRERPDVVLFTEAAQGFMSA